MIYRDLTSGGRPRRAERERAEVREPRRRERGARDRQKTLHPQPITDAPRRRSETSDADSEGWGIRVTYAD